MIGVAVGTACGNEGVEVDFNTEAFVELGCGPLVAKQDAKNVDTITTTRITFVGCFRTTINCFGALIVLS
jgi:hypothetical protein